MFDAIIGDGDIARLEVGDGLSLLVANDEIEQNFIDIGFDRLAVAAERPAAPAAARMRTVGISGFMESSFPPRCSSFLNSACSRAESVFSAEPAVCGGQAEVRFGSGRVQAHCLLQFGGGALGLLQGEQRAAQHNMRREIIRPRFHGALAILQRRLGVFALQRNYTQAYQCRHVVRDLRRSLS